MSAAVKVKLIKKRKWKRQRGSQREKRGQSRQSGRRKIVKYTHCVTRTKPRTLISLASYLTFDILKTLCIFSHICLTKWRRQWEHKGNREWRTGNRASAGCRRLKTFNSSRCCSLCCCCCVPCLCLSLPRSQSVPPCVVVIKLQLHGRRGRGLAGNICARLWYVTA